MLKVEDFTLGSGDNDRCARHDDKQASSTQAKQEASERKTHDGRRANKAAKVKWGRGKREANKCNAKDKGL